MAARLRRLLAAAADVNVQRYVTHCQPISASYVWGDSDGAHEVAVQGPVLVLVGNQVALRYFQYLTP